MRKIGSLAQKDENGQINPLKTNSLEVYSENGDLKEKINSEGFYTVRHRDEYTSGEWVAPSGSPAPDSVTVTIGGIPYMMLAYDGGSTEERKSNQFEIPHDLAIDLVNAETEKIEVHTHFLPSSNSAGVVKWFFDWVYLPPMGAAIPQTSLSFSYDIPVNKQYNHFLCGIELPIPTGGFEIGGVILFSIRRTPSDAGDTYPSDALLLKVALHVPSDGNGSRQRYIK